MSEEKTVDYLKPYTFHGMDLSPTGTNQAYGECPFCERDGKWFVNTTNGLWDCKVCGEKGNLQQFLTKLYAEGSVTTAALEQLCKLRWTLRPETLATWGVVQSSVTQEWVLPGYDERGKLSNLVRYVWNSNSKKYVGYVTPMCKMPLYGMPLFDGNKTTTFLCEGVWDAMVLWEVLGLSQRSGLDRVTLATGKECMLDGVNVLAVHSCNTFSPPWASLFSSKEVVLLFDNDHPKPHPKKQGQFLEPAAYMGMKRVTEILARSSNPPSSIKILNWGPEGYDPDLPSGTDIRDLLAKGLPKVAQRVDRLNQLLTNRITVIPEAWVEGRSLTSVVNGSPTIQPIPCDNWDDLINEWRLGMKWTEGLDRGLSVILAAGASVLVPGDQLWVMGISPPGSGKSTLAMSLAMCVDYTRSVDTIRGFHSGYQNDKNGEEDNSLIAEIDQMCMITKDGDTLLQSPNLPQILSEGRGVYDGKSNARYRNKMSKGYDNHRMVWLLFGTDSLRQLDDSELGQRFLSCVFMDEIDTLLERQINLKNLFQMRATYGAGHGINGQGSDTKNILTAQRMTAGYFKHLYEGMVKGVSQVEMSDEVLTRIEQYGRFVAYLRARPSKKQDEEVHRELSTRLCNQLGKLAFCLAVVMNRTTIDSEVLRRVRRTALDTARGRTLRIAEHLHPHGEQGCSLKNVQRSVGEQEDKCKALLIFLRKIKVVELTNQGQAKAHRWRLTDPLLELFDQLHPTETLHVQ